MSDQFIAGVHSLLKTQIRHRDYSLTQHLTEGSEALQHVRLALTAARDGMDNSDAVNQVRKALETGGDADAKVIVLLGPPGTAKTTIACQVARASVLWEPRRRVITRCLGSTLRSSSLYRVLESIINQVGVVYNCHVDLPEDALLPEVVSAFCAVLQSVGESPFLAGGLLIILDHLECLPDLEPRFLTSILDSLPPGVTLLLTCDSQSKFINVLKNHWSVQIVHRTFMNRKEVGLYMKESLNSVKRVATEDQYKTALGALPEEPAPVYPQILYHITRWWPSASLLDVPTFSGIPAEDFSIFISFVETGLGKAFSRYALSLLATARYGLADHELLHLLSKDADLLNEIEQEENERISFVEGFPYQLQLSNLIERLGHFLSNIKIEGESVYQLTSQPLRVAIAQRYMTNGFFHTIHQRLANFFLFIRRGLLLSSRDISEQRHRQLSKYHWRTLRCVPYHLCHISADTGQVWEQLKQKVFFNFTWLVNAVYSGFLPDLLDDLAYALETVSLDPDIQYLQQLLLQARHTIIHNPLSMAAVFSSQNPEDRERAVRDSVRALIHEARHWLTQVHLQALVPVTYTCDKSPRLMVKENSLFGLTSVHSIPDTGNTRGRLLLQRGRTMSVLDILTREEIPLVTLETDILGVKVVDTEHLMIMATGVSSGFSVELLNFNKGKHLKSAPLKETELLWYDMRSPNAVFFATEKGIKRLDVERMEVKNVLSSAQSPEASLISLGKADKVITVVNVEAKQEIRQMRLKDASSLKSTRVKEETVNSYCDPLITTKDGRFIVQVTERLVRVVETREFLVTSTISHHNLPIVKAALSRSHEHVFLAYANGSVTGHTLLSGLEVLSAKTRASPRPTSWSSGGNTEHSANTTRKLSMSEIITAMVTSEDDHFLMLGSNSGQVYIFHLPTGRQLVDITTGQVSLTGLIFLTDRSHFQHLVSLDAAGKAFHWNLRPLLAETRRIVHPYICDADMSREEQPKVDLSLYYPVFQAHSDDRVFLNGPDVAAFYQPVPETLFADLAHLDPAFGEQFDWEVKGTLADLNDHLMALVCGHELADVMLTVSSDFRLSQWSLKDGSLTWSRHLSGQGQSLIHDLTLVYWDQAVFLVQDSQLGTGHRVSVSNHNLTLIIVVVSPPELSKVMSVVFQFPTASRASVSHHDLTLIIVLLSPPDLSKVMSVVFQFPTASCVPESHHCSDRHMCSALFLRKFLNDVSDVVCLHKLSDRTALVFWLSCD
ncbi:NACHT and WD repeat domain-containing protein 2 [Elysia marginata]|uniref:NACHT and WD repeat domain-containing protein 2 n=1 Tax=Elysia marginata TaxID=1093978 RepID=A0AAV4EIR2_9GAST|nr:NACHT and WD repeat domain-containing protein 2 [Elysia marginata]